MNNNKQTSPVADYNKLRVPLSASFHSQAYLRMKCVTDISEVGLSFTQIAASKTL